MSLFNTRTRWGWPARALHWIIATMIFGLLAYGFYIANFLDVYSKAGPISLHKTFGLIVFLLIGARILWRAVNRVAPEHPPGSPKIERLAASATHIVLYGLMVLMPLSGWASASIGAEQMSSDVAHLFGASVPKLVTISNMTPSLEAVGLIAETDDPFGQPLDQQAWSAMKIVHKYIAWALTAVIALHVLAALKHHVINRDDVLRRMTFGGGGDR